MEKYCDNLDFFLIWLILLRQKLSAQINFSKMQMYQKGLKLHFAIEYVMKPNENDVL